MHGVSAAYARTHANDDEESGLCAARALLVVVRVGSCGVFSEKGCAGPNGDRKDADSRRTARCETKPNARSRAMSSVHALSLVRNGDVPQAAPTVPELMSQLRKQVDGVIGAVVSAGNREGTALKDFELALRDEIHGLGRAALELFLAIAEERIAGTVSVTQIGGRRFRTAPKQARNLGTMFGVVRYWRGYTREIAAADRRGFHPLDVELGLTKDRFTMNVLGTTTRLATKMSFAEAKATASLFIPQAPSTEVIERAVLGLGHHTEDWFASRPAPQGDGEVLVIMVDSKGAPTATELELARRRGKRSREDRAPSPRHRGRCIRRRHPRMPRRARGDHSKNARFATMVVMYTLKQCGNLMHGPINRWLYASFAPKEHAFQIARREADKRGFTNGSGKQIQIVTDGDNDLSFYVDRYFANATHTVDFMHVVEKLWQAGECIFREGTPEHRQWVREQRQRLVEGEEAAVLAGLKRHLARTPKTGPGNKGRRLRLAQCIAYFEKRIDRMRYDELMARDWETATGQIEGAIKNVVGKRCDHGGMRWIRERVEAVLQLRCIELNGDWDEFTTRVHDATQAATRADGCPRRLQTSTPRAVPENPETARDRKRNDGLKAAKQRRLAA